MLGIGIGDCGKNLLRDFQLFICQHKDHRGIIEFSNINQRSKRMLRLEVGAFYWTGLVPDIVNPGREGQDSFSV